MFYFLYLSYLLIGEDLGGREAREVGFRGFLWFYWFVHHVGGRGGVGWTDQAKWMHDLEGMFSLLLFCNIQYMLTRDWVQLG